MAKILLKFYIYLKNYDYEPFPCPHGPLFHRWLPRGEIDAITLDTGDENAKLRVWFDRFGYVDGRGIRFSLKKKEVDPKIVPTQAVLDGGPLIGNLEIRNISDKIVKCLENNKIGNDVYENFGKKVVKMIYPAVRKFLDNLRTKYGQYWIPNIEKWDSRNNSLGAYCCNLQIKWSLDNGANWEVFIPNKSVSSIAVTINKRFDKYLTEDDWNELKNTKELEEASLASNILSQACRFWDQGNLRNALVEGITALETAVHDFMKKKFAVSNSLYREIASVRGLPFKTQVILATTFAGLSSIRDIEKVVTAYEIRNKVVHEGENLPSDITEKLVALLKVTGMLIQGSNFRLLSSNPGNKIQSIEDWKRERTQVI